MSEDGGMDDEGFRELLEASSLGTRGARALRARASDADVERVRGAEEEGGEIVAPGFRLYSPDSEMGAIGNGWVITGRLPTEGPWRMFNHYDLQGKLVAEGLLRPEHCDSELGMFCVHPPDEETARLVGGWLNERL